MNMNNFYNNLAVDINRLHAEIDKKLINTKGRRVSASLGIVRFLTIKVLLKIGLFERLVDTGIIRGWFEIFKSYWLIELSGRPISVHDFYFLLCSYRVKFQDIEVAESSNSKEFCYAWQRQENLYSTFNAVYKNALNPTLAYGYLKYIRKGSAVLEYGCGLAPITHSFVKYFSYKNLDFSVADIKGFPFHYAKYYLDGYGVKYYNIDPYAPVKFNNKFDAIFLITVLEHLPNPDEVVTQLTNVLERGGILFFDYCKSNGTGLDTKESVLKRKFVLDYIMENYKLIKGKISFDSDMGLTVASKKGG
jgi:2-polyprenyl-3-methyl-5-hydroxy-6-metoxy-1,4-benzoquinol methylase